LPDKNLSSKFLDDTKISGKTIPNPRIRGLSAAKVCTAEFVREIFIRQNLSADRFFRSINGPLTLKKAFGKKVSMCPTSIRRPSYAGCLKQGWKRHFRG